MNKLQTIEWFSEGDEDKDWNIVEYEAYVQYHFQSFYEVEMGVYDRIKDVQGIDVPRLIAQVRYLGSVTHHILRMNRLISYLSVREFSQSILKVEFSWTT